MQKSEHYNLIRILEADTDGSGDLSPDELRDLADDLEGEPLTGQELRDALISHISDMHKDIWGARPRYDFNNMSVEDLETMHDYVTQQHKDWHYELRVQQDLESLEDLEREKEEELTEPGLDLDYEKVPQRSGMRRRVSEMKTSTKYRLKMIIRETLCEAGRINPDYAPDQPDKYYSIGDWAVENLLYNDVYSSHREKIRSSRSYRDARAYIDELMEDPSTKSLNLRTRPGNVDPNLMIRAAVHGPDLGYGQPLPKDETVPEIAKINESLSKFDDALAKSLNPAQVNKEVYYFDPKSDLVHTIVNGKVKGKSVRAPHGSRAYARWKASAAADKDGVFFNFVSDDEAVTEVSASTAALEKEMKITRKQLRQIIKEEIEAISESLPYEKSTVFDVWAKGPWVSSSGGHSRGPSLDGPLGRVKVSDPQYASELMRTLGKLGFNAGKIKPIYDNDEDGVVDWDEFVDLLQDFMKKNKHSIEDIFEE